MGPSRSSTAHLDGLGTFSPNRSWLPGFHRAMSLHPSRCNGYVTGEDNKPARYIRMMRVAILGALALLALPTAAVAAEKPNLLGIITDDQATNGPMEVMPATR